ncbi:VOC family protein [Neobacillus sp. LXY-4]|uniref:VOC family protein n=1 Tax=Neobacillus sp. LXY-4 TaxID=3379826 RepID=UPI003EDF02F2
MEDARFSHPSLPYQVIVRKEWNKKVPAVQFRIARPTNQIQKIIEFYELGIGLEKIGEFSQHEGYQGVMFGAPDHQYHLEFTQFETPVQLPTPTKEHLLVFYIPDLFERNVIVSRLESMGYRPVEPENPYWSRGGITIEDPDGWRVVLMNTPGISGN